MEARNGKAWTYWIAAIGGLLFSFLAFYPGLLSRDSIDQLAQARSGVFSDWHPPVMAAVWRVIDQVWPGPAGMLLLHDLIFWAGLGLLAAASGMGAGALAIGLLPPILGEMGAIWKDVAMGACLVLAVASLKFADRGRGRLGWLTLAGLSMFYATAVRHNAPAAIFPLCLWAGLVLTEEIPSSPRPRPWHALFNGLAIFLGLTFAASAANFALTSQFLYPVQQIYLHDLAAISLDQGQLLFPSSLRPPELISIADLAPLYSTSEVVPLYGNSADKFSTLTDPQSVKALQDAWIDTVPKHLWPYLKHRFRVFQQLIGIKRRDVCLPYHLATDDNSLGVQNPTNWFHRAVMGYLDWFRNSLFFRGWVYFLLSWGFLGALISRAILRRRLPARSEAGAWAVSASGAFYLSLSFFIVPTCDFRMLWWTALSVLIFPFMMDPRDRLRLRYRLLPNVKALITRETEGSQPSGKRLCLFAHFDAMNRVSDAVVYYVRALQELGLEVRFISTNEALPETETAKVRPYCSKIILRRNVGIDFGSWLVGWHGVDVRAYDQLVLANDSVFGPFQPLAPIFEKMGSYDLWGMTENREGGIAHLQSYFLVFNARALHSEALRQFWAEFRFYLRKSSYIRHYEIGLSALAESWRTGAFIDAKQAADRALADPGFSQHRTHLESGAALNPTLFLWDVLIRDLGFPFLKVELPRLNRLKMANIIGWRKVVASVSSYDPELIEKALERRTGARETRKKAKWKK